MYNVHCWRGELPPSLRGWRWSTCREVSTSTTVKKSSTGEYDMRFTHPYHPYEKSGCKHTYTHTYIHTYIHTYMHTYIHTYIRTYIRTYIHTYIHGYVVGGVAPQGEHGPPISYIHTYIHTFIHAYLHTYVHT